MPKIQYINVYRGQRGRLQFGFCRFRKAQAAKAGATKDGTYLYTLKLSRSSVSVAL